MVGPTGEKSTYLENIKDAFSNVKEMRNNPALSPEAIKAKITGEIETAKNRIKTSKQKTISAETARAAPDITDKEKANKMLFTARMKLLANTIFAGTDAIKNLFGKTPE